MQYSFYGGQQGKNFEIAAIFENKIQMMQDLMKRYQSQVAIGDLVLISYGMPNEETPSYRHNAELDVESYGHTYNATLWQKIYTEENNQEIQDITGTEIEYVSKDFGLGYKLIAVLTGNTPVFQIKYDALKANQRPFVTIDNTNIDLPILIFHLPVSQILALKNTLILNADQQPQVVLDTTDINNLALQFSLPQAQEILPKNVSTTILNADEDPKIIMDNDGSNADGTLKVNKPTVEFRIPQAQEIRQENVSTTILNADEDPNVVFNNSKTETNVDGSKKVNKPTLEFRLPQSQIVGLGNVTAINADLSPAVRWDNSQINTPKIHFDLPKSQVLQLNSTIVLAPSEDPKSEYDDSGNKINLPELTFSLPRAVRFMYGSRLGTREDSNGVYTLTISDAPEIENLRTGDYYVHEGTGFIYLVTAEDTTYRTFTYQACLAAPVPTVTAAAVDTYEVDGVGFKVKDPVLKKSWSDPIEQIGLVLGFELPKLPNLGGGISFVGPDEAGKIEGKPTDVNEYTYFFTIPSGTRFYGTKEGDTTIVDDDHLNVIIPGARPGDFYINGVFSDKSDGHLYKLGMDKVWILQGSIKGNVGNPLNITHDYVITPTEVAHDTLDEVSSYLTNTLHLNPDGHEIIAITYRAPAIDGGTIDTAYWYYVANGKWGRTQLTGATASLIETSYKVAGDTNKAYSVTYINNLLAVDIPNEEKTRRTYSAKAIDDKISWGSFSELL